MRVIISPIGSFRFIVGSSLPARSAQPRNQPLGAEFPHRNAAHFQLAVISPRPAGHLAAVADARRRAVARQRRKLNSGFEALLERLVPVAGDCLEPRPLTTIPLAQPAPAGVFFSPHP